MAGMRTLRWVALVLLVSACGAGTPGEKTGQLRLYEATATQIAVIDTSTHSAIRHLPLGVPSPDWTHLYSIRGDALVDSDPLTAIATRTLALAGRYQLPAATSTGLPGGTSHNGLWLVVASYEGPATHFVIIDTGEWRVAQTVDLQGMFRFDAISNDGQRLYLIQYLNGKEYYVRLYDVASHQLDANIVVDKSNGEQSMTGTRLSGIATPGGDWLFSMYVRESEGPFIHALNLTGPFAFCLDLPGSGYASSDAEKHWAIAMDSTGNTLYAVNSATGIVADVDNSQQFNPQIKRTVHISGGAPVGVGSNAALLSHDGKWLVAAGSSGVVWIDTSTLAVQMQALEGWHVWTLGMSSDGSETFALSDSGRVAEIATNRGQVLATFDSTETRPVALMRVASA